MPRQVTWVRQPHNCCGQTCVAMLADINLQDSIWRFKKKGLTRTKDLVRVLRELGFKVPDRLVRAQAGRTFPAIAILKLNFYRDGKRLSKSHWILRYNGINYDPAREEFEMPTNGKITSFLPIQEGGHA